MPKIMPLFMPPDQRRELIRQAAVDGVQSIFPIVGDHRELEVTNVRVDQKEFTTSDHKEALLAGKTLAEPVKADVVIRDKNGKVIDQKKNHTVLNLPYFTGQNTFVVNGTEYSVRHQLRTMPGVYTRVRGNGDLEANFNLEKGTNFRVSMDPEKGHLQMEYGTSKIPLYSVLRGMGMNHSDISNAWGGKLADMNQEAFDGKRDAHLGKLYEKLLPEYKRTAQGKDEVVKAIQETFDASKINPITTEKTLGRPFEKVSAPALLAASQKLLKVHKGEVEQDNRDSLEFQSMHSVENFVKERLSLKSREITKKYKSKLDLANDVSVAKVLPHSSLTPSVQTFLTMSQLSTTPGQINPAEMLAGAMTVTRFGEGGIASERAIPGDVRNVDTSQLGILDPFATPESSHAGVDVKAAITAHKDENGKIYTPLWNIKKSTVEMVPVEKLDKEVIAFHNQDITKGRVDVLNKGKVGKVKAGQASYQVLAPETLYSVGTNLIPFMDSDQGNRLIMGSKHVTQALPLKNNEAPLVRVKSDLGAKEDDSNESRFSEQILPMAKSSGVISKITKDQIHVKDKDGKVHKHDFATYLPLASKTYLKHYLNVKEGDKVKEGQKLADSNFTRDGALALGKNLNVAYVAYHGYNSNDAVVISESAAKKLTSKHMYKKITELDDESFLDQKKHQAQFPRAFTKDQYEKLDKGVIKPGMILNPGDPIATVVRKAPPSTESQMFGRIHKSLRRAFRDDSLVWDKDVPGKVIDVVNTNGRVAVTVKSEEPMGIGDKLSNRHGGKGVVAKILPDEEMLKTKDGKTMDLLWTSTGVLSRINPAQILETAVGKVAQKTGKPIAVANFAQRDNVKYVKELLKKHDIKDKETLIDPVTGKEIPNIFVGPQYTYKLFKSTDTNYSARGVNEGYDINQQPSKGGTEGAKGTGRMEINALLAYNARDTLKENAIVKGTRNTEYWKAVQLGLPTPAPKNSFAYDKFTGLLQASGMKVKRDGDYFSLAPLTDDEIKKVSAGAIDNAKMVTAKDLKAEKGGLFDEARTGGLNGTKWTHIDLPEPVVHPVFQDSVKRVLGVTGSKLEDLQAEKGGAHIKKLLAGIDPGKTAKELRKQVDKMPAGAAQDNVVKQIKALEALDKQGLTPDKAWTISKLPVLPPQFRPVVPGPRGDMLVADVNHLYKDAIIARDKLKEAKDLDMPDEDVADLRKHMSQAVGAVIGMNDPVTTKAAETGKKGLLTTVVGTKTGFFNGKVIANRLDLSARGTAAPDPSLGLDEVGIPEEMAWSTYKPFVMKRLVKAGQPAVRAKQMIEDKHPTARTALLAETSERPILLNRAPTLHKYNIVAAYPKLIPGKTVKVNPFIEEGMNLDYDGDALQLHVPASIEAVNDARNMLVSKNLMGERTQDSLQVFPGHEAIVGVYLASKAGKKDGKTKDFKDVNDALSAYEKGQVGLGDKVKLAKSGPRA
jgi:DNA-directed RNA polymerase subunit beta